MNPDTLKLLKDIREELAVALAWPASIALRSRINIAINRAEHEQPGTRYARHTAEKTTEENYRGTRAAFPSPKP